VSGPLSTSTQESSGFLQEWEGHYKVLGSSALQLCGSTMFIKFLLTAEFEVLVSVTQADNVGLAGKGLGSTSFLNGYLCIIGSAEFHGLHVGGKGNCGPSLAFLELAVSLTLGAVFKRPFMLVPDTKK